MSEHREFDDVTGLPTHVQGMRSLAREIEIVRLSSKSELAIAVVDIDDLEGINQHSGSAAGNAALRGLANALRRHARRSHDVVFRNGGGEFVCALPLATLQEGTALLLEIWHTFNEEGLHSFSAGFSELREGDDAMTVVNRAAACLHAGKKRSGRRAWRLAS